MNWKGSKQISGEFGCGEKLWDTYNIYIRIHIHYNRIFHRGPNNPVRVLVISTVSRRFGLFLEASPIPSEGTHVWNAFVSFLPLISGRPGGRFSKLFSDEKFLHADDRHHKPELENQVNHLPNFPYLSLSPKLPTAISSSLHIGFWIQIGEHKKIGKHKPEEMRR